MFVGLNHLGKSMEGLGRLVRSHGDATGSDWQSLQRPPWREYAQGAKGLLFLTHCRLTGILAAAWARQS